LRKVWGKHSTTAGLTAKLETFCDITFTKPLVELTQPKIR